MSAKRDAIANMGGLLGVREEGEHVTDVKSLVISYQGYVTYGGMSGRDLAALAVGLLRAWTSPISPTASARPPTSARDWTSAGSPTSGRRAGTRSSSTPDASYRTSPGTSSRARHSRSSCTSRRASAGPTSAPTSWTAIPSQARPSARRSSSRVWPCRVAFTPSSTSTSSPEALGEVAARAESVRGYEVEWEPKVLRHFTSNLRPV